MDLSNPSKVQFGDLPRDFQMAMFEAYLDRQSVEFFNGLAWSGHRFPSWDSKIPYRIVPAGSKTITLYGGAYNDFLELSKSDFRNRKMTAPLGDDGFMLPRKYVSEDGHVITVEAV